MTDWIEQRANDLLTDGLNGVASVPFEQALQAPHPSHDFLDAYVDDLASVIDMEAIQVGRVKLGVDPLGGAAWLTGTPVRSATASTWRS